MMDRTESKRVWLPSVLLAFSALLAGGLYYLVVRGGGLGGVTDFTFGSFPSFVHALAFYLLFNLVLSSNRFTWTSRIYWNLAALAGLLVIEVTLGVFSWLDTAIEVSMACTGFDLGFCRAGCCLTYLGAVRWRLQRRQ